MQVMREEKEILIPISDDVIIKVARDKKQINVDCPEGLLEIYMD